MTTSIKISHQIKWQIGKATKAISTLDRRSIMLTAAVPA